MLIWKLRGLVIVWDMVLVLSESVILFLQLFNFLFSLFYFSFFWQEEVSLARARLLPVWCCLVYGAKGKSQPGVWS